LVVGGGWLYIAQKRAENEQQARALQAELTREAEEALSQATSLRAQARAEGSTGKWAEARAQARRAETLLERLSDEPGLNERVHALLRDMDDEEDDRRLLARVEEIRLLRSEVGPLDIKLNYSRGAPEYQAALRAYGVAVGMPP